MATTEQLGELVDAAMEMSSSAFALQVKLGQAKQDARLTAEMEQAGFAPGGPLQYAPRDHQVQVWNQLKAADDEQLGRAYADLDDAVKIIGRAVVQVERESEEPPSVADALLKRSRGDTSGTAVLLRDMLALDIERTVGPMVDRATVAEARRLYAAALADPDSPRSAAVVAAIEKKTIDGSFGPEKDVTAAVDALAALSKDVRAARAARVPAAAMVWRQALKDAEQARQLAKAANVKKAPSVEQQHLITLMKALA